MGCVGTEVGCAGSECVTACAREIVAGGVGIVVQEDRNAVSLGPPLPEVARGLYREVTLGRGAGERDEGDDVECAEKRVYSVVPVDRDVGRDRVGELTGGSGCIERGRPGEREDRSMMVGVGVHVDE